MKIQGQFSRSQGPPRSWEFGEVVGTCGWQPCWDPQIHSSSQCTVLHGYYFLSVLNYDLMCGHSLNTMLACCKHSLGVVVYFIPWASMRRRAREKFRAPVTPAGRRWHWRWALRTCVCLVRLDWKGIPSKGESRGKSRKRTSPPSIQERVDEWFSVARLQSVFVSRNGL